jgi:signal peptidase I
MWLFEWVRVEWLLGAWPVLLALWGRWPRAVMWTCVSLTFVVVSLVEPRALWLAVAVAVPGSVDAVRVMWRGRPARRHLIPAVLVLVAHVASWLIVLAFVVGTYRNPSAGMCPTLASGDHFLVDRLSIRWRAPQRGDVIVFDAPDGRTFIKRVVAIGGDVIAVRDGAPVLNGTPVPTTRVGDTTFWREDVAPDGHISSSGEVPAIESAEELGGHRYHVLHDRDVEPRERDFPLPARGGVPGDACEDATPRRSRYAPRDAADGWPVLATAPDGCRVPDGAVFVLGDGRDESSDSRVWGPVPLDRVIGRVTGIWLPGDAPSRAWRRMGPID